MPGPDCKSCKVEGCGASMPAQLTSGELPCLKLGSETLSACSCLGVLSEEGRRVTEVFLSIIESQQNKFV